MEKTRTQPTTEIWKGFRIDELAPFGVHRTAEGIEIPYFTREGQRYRDKLFMPDGRTTWTGESKPQIPYGLDTLRLGGRAIVLTEGESDALALRLAYPELPVLGIPGAASWKADWKTYCADFTAVYLSFDGDGPGMNLTDTVWADLPGARYVAIPEGFDTRDVLQTLGKRAYRVLLEDAANRSELSKVLRLVADSGQRCQRVGAALRERRRAA